MMNNQSNLPPLSGDLFRVGIPTSKTLSDADSKYTSFQITIQSPFASWVVHRRFKQFFALNTQMQTQLAAKGVACPAFPKKKLIGLFQQAFIEERRDALETYLQQLLKLPQPMSYSPLVEFLQDSGNLSLQLQMLLMKGQLRDYQAQVANLHGRLQQVVEEARISSHAMDAMERRMKSLEKLSSGNGVGVPNTTDMSSSSPHLGLASSPTLGETSLTASLGLGGGGVTGVSQNRRTFSGDIIGNLDDGTGGKANEIGSLSSFLPPAHPVMVGRDDILSSSRGRIGSSGDWTDGLEPVLSSRFSPTPGYFIKQVLGVDKDAAGSERPHLESLESVDPLLLGRGNLRSCNESEDFPFNTAVNSNEDNESSLALGDLIVSDGGDDRDSMHTSDTCVTSRGISGEEIIPAILLNFSSEASMWDRLADEIVTMVQPQESQILYRLSASRYVTKHTRKILGAQVYDIGMQGLRCFLPDDPIRLSVFLSRSAEAGWYVRLNEQMCRLSGSPTMLDETDVSGGGDHSLSNVSFVSSSETSGHKLQCIVDSVLGVEVVANVRLEMCLMAFLEDFDRLLGRDHLFKRSLLLIRAWWIYETKLPSPSGISDSALCVMVLSVLNRFHSKVFHPFHALCFFLAEFSTLNFSSHIVTIDGPVPQESYMASSSCSSRKNSATTLISMDYLNRYRKLTLAIDEDESSTMELLSETIGDDSMSDAVFVSNRIMSKSSQVHTVCAFAPKPIMIAHPLLPGMIFDSPVQQMQRKVSLIVDELRTGAQRLLPILRASFPSIEQTGGVMSSHEMVEGFFKNITNRFGRGWRPDVNPTSSVMYTARTESRASRNSHSSQDHRRLSTDSTSPMASIDTAQSSEDFASVKGDLFWISLDKVWERIRYCNLLLESQITESALRTLSRQVLDEKGSLPVGEIGKMLQEACLGIPNMSVVIKERFGGLKKFLEHFPDDFVLARDHPFNPSVYLQDSLSADELGMIMRGEPLVRSSPWSGQKQKRAGSRGQYGSTRHGTGGGALNLRKKNTSPGPGLQQSPSEMHYSGHSGGVPLGQSRTFSSEAPSLRTSIGSSSIGSTGGQAQGRGGSHRYSLPGPGGGGGHRESGPPKHSTGTVLRSNSSSGLGNLSNDNSYPLHHTSLDFGDAQSRSNLAFLSLHAPSSDRGAAGGDHSLFSNSSVFGRMGMPDPTAREFVPTAGGVIRRGSVGDNMPGFN